MREKDIVVPRFLQWLHGERVSAIDLVLVYATAAVFGALALLFAWSRVAGLSWWRSIVLFLVAADVSGGIVANFCASTDRYYAARPGARWVFIFAHIVEPVVLFALFGGRLGWWMFLFIYAAAASSIANVLEEGRRQETLAAAFTALGLIITVPLGLETPFLAWFGPAYLVKLALAFAVRRT